MAFTKHGREVRKLSDAFQSDKAMKVLTQLNIRTIDDLVQCPFGRLMRSPTLLCEWDSIIDCVMYSYNAHQIQGIRKV